MEKILITGGNGLVGKAIKKVVGENSNYYFSKSSDADLTDFKQCNELFQKIKPTKVIHLAANVGGLFKNMNHKVEMFEKNILINFNVVKCSHIFGVQKLIGCLSTCIFPDKIPYPINEEMLHKGPPHASNDTYSYAKRMLQIQCKAYNEQFNNNFICVIPTNIYGPNDNFNLKDSHVIPGLIHKCYLAKKNKQKFIVSGTGKPLRQFIFSEDLARIIIWILENPININSIIISPDIEAEISIKKIAELIAIEFNYLDFLEYDITQSDGQYKKTANNTKLKNLYGDLNLVNIEIGIKKTIKWFIDNYDLCRK